MGLGIRFQGLGFGVYGFSSGFMFWSLEGLVVSKVLGRRSRTSGSGFMRLEVRIKAFVWRIQLVFLELVLWKQGLPGLCKFHTALHNIRLEEGQCFDGVKTSPKPLTLTLAFGDMTVTPFWE